MTKVFAGLSKNNAEELDPLIGIHCYLTAGMYISPPRLRQRKILKKIHWEESTGVKGLTRSN